MIHQLRDGSPVGDIRLDRLVQFDERSRAFPVTAALGEDRPVITKLWTIPHGSPVLDQGAEGACAGFGITNELRFNPVPVRGLDETFARERVYYEAQKIDPWAGGSYPGASPWYEGTSVLAAVKVAATLNFYTEYRWAFNETDMARSVSYLGPVIIGVPWYEGMFSPDATGYLRPTGALVGGHCTLVVGVSAVYGYYTIYNSWGPAWGNAGRARISRADMATLLAQQGEACVITGRNLPIVH